MRPGHDGISPKLYRVETHLEGSKIDSFSFVFIVLSNRREDGNIYPVIDIDCPALTQRAGAG